MFLTNNKCNHPISISKKCFLCHPLCCPISATGPTGPTGATGATGLTGQGIQIDGHVNTFEQLPTTELFNGMLYSVGTGNPRNLLYVYNEQLNQWINEGTLCGPKGDNGITPEIGSNENWWIGDTDTGKPSRGEKGEKGEAGERFYPAYASFYSSSEQTFPAQPTEYSFVKFQGVVINEISLENETDIKFDHDGTYLINYTLTVDNKPNLATVAILYDDGTAKSNSVQAIKIENSQTCMSFITKCYKTKRLRLGILTSEELSLENVETNLVNASLTILEIKTQSI